LKTLLEIMPLLAARGTYLKVFIPVSAKNHLDALPPSIHVTKLAWDETALRQMLEQRIRRAGAASFKALFRRVPPGKDPATCLVQAALRADGPPRQLIRLGQELLIEHVRQSPDDPRLHWEEVKIVLEGAT
jgi:hypothetical protein